MEIYNNNDKNEEKEIISRADTEIKDNNQKGNYIYV